ncbi:MAG: hypothetical protein LBF58_09230 [Deltaproteobacteria bacterium]|jgi:hypothetical protein|nr:hypothetical protein [Deltaproteobacteria bacterium]
MFKRLIISCLAALAALAIHGNCMAQTSFVNKLADLAGKYVDAKNRFLLADDGRSWIPFLSSDKTKARVALDEHLDKALAILLDDSIIKTKDKIRDLYNKNSDLEMEISELGINRIGAPEGKKFYEVWKSTASDMDEKISDLRAQIRKNSATIDRLMGEIVSQLNDAKIPMTREQVRNFFIAASGEDQLQSIVALKNLYAICDILKQSLAGSTDLNFSKKYYGVFLLATDAHKKQLEDNLGKIDNVYIPRLLEIQRDNEALMAQTMELAASKPQYRNNVIAQEQTLQVTQKFQVLLKNQATIVMDRLTALDGIIEFAENTYLTVSLAASLSNVMDQSAMNLQAILGMPVMPPLEFENSLESKYLEITHRLSAE